MEVFLIQIDFSHSPDLEQAEKYDKNKTNLEKSFLQQFGGLELSLYKANETLTN